MAEQTESFPALTNAMRMLGLPLNLGAHLFARGGDEVANLIARMAGRARNPSEQEQKTAPGVDASFRAWENALRDVRDKSAFGANAAMDAMGWKPAPETAAPGGVLPQASGPRPLPGPSRTRGVFEADEDLSGIRPSGTPPFVPNPIARGALPSPRPTMPGTPPPMMPPPAEQPTGVLPAPDQAETPEPRKSAAERFRERMAGIGRGDAGLTKEQKDRAALEMWLAMLAGNKPGSKFLTALGEGGLHRSALERQMEEKNQGKAERERREAREDIRGEFDVERHEEDQGLRRREIEERGKDRATQREIEQQRVDLLKRHIEQGKWKVLDNGKTGTYVLFDAASGETKDTGIKVPSKGTDNTPAEVRLLQYLEKNPRALEIYSGTRRGSTASREMGERDIVEQALKSINPEMGGTSRMSIEDAVAQVMRARDLARGNAAPAPGTPSAPYPEGTQLIGKDGKRYVVKNGRPVPEGK